MITLGALQLPDGLFWSDEIGWSPIAESAGDYSLTGALLIQRSVKQAGRPITLRGAQASSGDSTLHTAILMRNATFRGWPSLLTLKAALDDIAAQFTLTLHDGRTFTVAPCHDGDGPLIATAIPALSSLPPADPQDDHWYFIDTIRLRTV